MSIKVKIQGRDVIRCHAPCFITAMIPVQSAMPEYDMFEQAFSQIQIVCYPALQQGRPYPL
jgi:hypothetical protein